MDYILSIVHKYTIFGKKFMLIIIVKINQHIHISNHIQLPRFFLTVAIEEKHQYLQNLTCYA